VDTPYEVQRPLDGFSLLNEEKETKARLPEDEKIEIFQNTLVPKHVLLSKEETQSVLDLYKIKPYQLPYIKSTDPAARAIDAQPGAVVKIIRTSQTAGSAVAYRYVVEG
jgi:DNA-directed RNA polymerase subunit H